MADPSKNNDDNWKRAVDMLTGYILPDRSTLFDKLKGNEDIPLMHVRLDKVGNSALVDGFTASGGWGRSNTDYVIPYYRRGNDGDGEVSAGDALSHYKAHITLLGKNGDAPPSGNDILTGTESKSKKLKTEGGWNKQGGALEWSSIPLAQYVHGSLLALEQLALYPHSTQGFENRGNKVADNSYVDLLSFTDAAKAFDRAVKFFENSADAVKNWDSRDIGESSTSWDGSGASLFKNLVHKLARNYEGYAEQISAGEGYVPVVTLDGETVGSKPARAISEAQFIIQREAVNLHDAWQAWKSESSPHRWLYDLLLEAHLSLFDNQYDHVDFVSGSGTSAGITVRGEAGFKNTITIDGKDYGAPNEMSTWKAVGDEAVRRWNISVQNWLDKAAADSIVAINEALRAAAKAFDGSLKDTDTRSLEDIATKEETKKEKAEAKKERENAKKDRDQAMAQNEKDRAQAEKDRREAKDQNTQDRAEAEQEKAAAKAQNEQDRAAAEKEDEEAKAQTEKEKAEAKTQNAQDRAEAEKERDQAKAQNAQDRAAAEKENEEAKAQAEKEKAEAKAQNEQDRAEAKNEAVGASAAAGRLAEQQRAEAKKERDEVKAQNAQDRAAAEKENEEAKAQAEKEKAEAKAQNEQDRAKSEKERAEALAQNEQDRAEARSSQEETKAQAESDREEARQQALQKETQAKFDAAQAKNEAQADFEQEKAEAKADRDAAEQEANRQEAEAKKEYEQEKAATQEQREKAEQQAEKDRAEAKGELDRQVADGQVTQAEADKEFERRSQEIEDVRHDAVADADAAEADAKREYEAQQSAAQEDREQARQDAEQARQDAQENYNRRMADAQTDLDRASGGDTDISELIRQRVADLPQPPDLSSYDPAGYSPYSSDFTDNLYNQDDLAWALGREGVGASVAADSSSGGSSGSSGPGMYPPPMRGGGGGGDAGGGAGERTRNVLDSSIGRPGGGMNSVQTVQDEEHRVTSRPAQTSSGMPFMPPMGGMGGGGGEGQTQTQSGDRERTTWLAEDEDVWGTDEGGAPQALGR